MFLSRYCDYIPNVLFALTVLVNTRGGYGSDVTKEVFQDPPTAMVPVAVGDFNNDRIIDTVFLATNLSTIQVFFGSENIPYLEPRTEYSCDLSYLDSTSTVKIVAISVADLTADGVLDIIVSTDQGQYVNTYIFRGSSSRFDCRPSNLISFADSGQTYLRLRQEPLIIDVNSDTIADILVENTSGGRDVWIFTNHHSQLFSLPCNSSKCFPLSKPHCSAFADLDSDFSPELIIVSMESSRTHHLELYTISGSRHTVSTQKYLDLEVKVGNITPPRIGSLIAMDMNQMSETVLVIPYCNDIDCHESGLMIYEKDANNFTNLNVQFNGWNFLISEPSRTPYAETIHIRVADFDLDGYPDLIGTLVNKSTTQSQSVVFLNVPCAKKNCNYNRTFLLNFEDLKEYDNVINTMLYDFYDDGLLDVLTISLAKKRDEAKEMEESLYKIRVWRNTPKYDAYFLKTMICGHCQPPNCPGTAVPGASLKYQIKDQRGLTKGKMSLLFRSYTMDLPVIIAGIGSSPNFIDEVTVGRAPYVNSWKQIIPNSFLLVYQNDDTKWHLKHYLSVQPKGAIETLIFLVIWLLVTAGLVVFFSIKELKEDRRNNVQGGSLNFIRLS